EQPDMKADPRYATQDDRLKHRPTLTARLAGIFATRGSQAWLRVLEKAGVPAGPIYKMDEVFADPQVEHLGIAVRVPDKNGGGLTLVGQPFELSRTPAQFNSLLGEAGADNDELLKTLGFDQAEIDALRQERAI
ncbi:MAG: hypothetical protein B7Y75_04700, partial [Azorhizobium sp. 35-67-5]